MERNFNTWLLIFVFILIMASDALAGTTRYVDNDASAGGDGLSWPTAFKYLQDGLAAASYGDEIRVAQGTYIPDQNSVNPGGTGEREATFQLINGVALKGGYAGAGEPDPNEQDVETYETILSGDLAGDDGPDFANNEENACHVITGSGTGETAILDGFSVSGGKADSSCTARYGGGMYNDSGSPGVINCTFTGNAGGGMYNYYSSPTVTNCIFTACTCGMYNYSSNPTVTNCIFIGNSGSGMRNTGSGPIVSNCTFIGNSMAYGSGGGMYNNGGSARLIYCTFSENSDVGMANNYSDLTLMNCTFSGNEVHGIQSHDGSQTLTNCIFTGNISQAEDYGGGGMSIGHNCNSVLINCILWGNIARANGPQIAMDGCILTVSYCDIQGAQVDISGYGTLNWLDGNIGEDLVNDNPLFVLPGYWDMETWVDGDYHLKSTAGRWDANSEDWVTDDVNSPCIDAGDPNSDWSAELWPHGKRINMGAYGGTAEASMSESPAGNIADLDANDVVNYADLKLFTDGWLQQQVLLSEDLDRDGLVNFADFAIFAGEWFWEE